MDVNDNAGCLNARGVPAFFVGTPPGAGSLLQGNEFSEPARDGGVNLVCLFNGCQSNFLQATAPCVIAYRYARIRRLVRLRAHRYLGPRH
jgi:hypothetical protein